VKYPYVLSTLWQDLCDKLWDICDHRREEVEGERGRIVEDQWLDDHIGLLSNHYITLMQVCVVCMYEYGVMDGEVLVGDAVVVTIV